MPDRNRFNPEFYHNRSVELQESVSKEESLAWYQSPCTEALLNSLEGDLAGFIVMWIGGAYFNEESAAGTAQSHSKALGMVQAIQGCIDRIKEIKDQRLEGEDY